MYNAFSQFGKSTCVVIYITDHIKINFYTDFVLQGSMSSGCIPSNKPSPMNPCLCQGGKCSLAAEIESKSWYWSSNSLCSDPSGSSGCIPRNKPSNIYCVSQKERVRENQRPFPKMCPPYSQFYFWFTMYFTLGSLCKKICSINQSVLKMWLWLWTQIKIRIENFRLLLRISTSVWALKIFLYAFYSPASVAKIDITNRYLIKLKLLYDMNPGDTYIFEGVRYVRLSSPHILLTPLPITPRKFALSAKDPILFLVFDQMLQTCHTMAHF